MTLFTGKPLPEPDSRVQVHIFRRRWTLGFFVVIVADFDPSLYGFRRLGLTRSYSAALALAERWLILMERRRDFRHSANSG